MIVDILVCNALGIALGMATVRYFEMKPYQWVSWDWKRGPSLDLCSVAACAFGSLLSHICVCVCVCVCAAETDLRRTLLIGGGTQALSNG